MVRINTLFNDEQSLTDREMFRVIGGRRKHRHCVEVETIVKTQYVPVYTPVYGPVFRPVLVTPDPEVRYLPNGTRTIWYP